MVFGSLFGQRKLVIFVQGSFFSTVKSDGFLLLGFGFCSGFGGTNIITLAASLLEMALLQVSSTLSFWQFCCSFWRGWEGESSVVTFWGS